MTTSKLPRFAREGGHFNQTHDLESVFTVQQMISFLICFVHEIIENSAIFAARGTLHSDKDKESRDLVHRIVRFLS